MGDWQTIASIVSGLIAIAVLMINLFDRSLSIREHEEFRRNLEERFKLSDHQREREIDRLESRVRVLEQTRPTTGELQAHLKALSKEVKPEQA